MKMGYYLWMMKMLYHFASFTMARLTLQQRRFVISRTEVCDQWKGTEEDQWRFVISGTEVCDQQRRLEVCKQWKKQTPPSPPRCCSVPSQISLSGWSSVVLRKVDILKLSNV